MGAFRIGESLSHSSEPSSGVGRPSCFGGALLCLQGLQSRGFAMRQGGQTEAMFPKSFLPLEPS